MQHDMEAEALHLLRTFLLALLLMSFSITANAQDGKIQLIWQNAPDTVMYELEIASVPINRNTPASSEQIIYTATSVYTPGIELDLSLFQDYSLQRIYYRVRPLDLDKNAIGPFTKPVPLSRGNLNPTKPAPTAYFNKRPTPLYPVYSWIPVLDAARYEIEITDRLPENPNGTQSSQYKIRTYSINQGFDYYDTEAFTEEGVYFWRVLAIDSEGNPLGTYSDAVPFKVQTGSFKWAIFGDSITHGGGAISNPPSDDRFDYSYYLPFAAKNLGRSGDTAAMLAERFETDVLPFKPQFLLILGGSNSIRGGASAEDVIASLMTIKQKCQANGIVPIFMTLPPVNPERIQRVFNQPTSDNWQEELTKVNDFIRTQPYAVDLYQALADENGQLPVKYAQDGLHPDISGKKIMARTIIEYLKKYRTR